MTTAQTTTQTTAQTTAQTTVPARPPREAQVPPPGEPYADIVETHTSVLVFVGGLVYKGKKPVTFPFLDLSTQAARLENCLRELELNRRFSPDVYLGLSEILPMFLPGAIGEPVLVMRRMPRIRRLSALLAAGQDVRPWLADIARQLAALHARELPAEGYDLARTMGELWREGREQLVPFDAVVLPRADLDAVAALAREYLAGRRDLLDRRESAGYVRPGHGDLLSEDIFCLDDGPRLLDCLEFDERLRTGDTLLDAAFLAMDLEAHGDPSAGRWFLDRYRRDAGCDAPASLDHHYIAYRAFVRAKVECLRHRQGAAGALAAASDMLGLCRRHLDAGRVRLLLLGGLPATGKSTVARTLVDNDPVGRQWLLLSSDAVRKELAGLPAEASYAAPYRRGLYRPSWTDLTYDELLRRAQVALRQGLNVVIDASWSRARHRQQAHRAASAASATLTEVRCEAPLDVCAERIRTRRDGASDADVGVLAAMSADYDHWPQAHAVQTTATPEAAARAALTLVSAAPLPEEKAGDE
ncbi:MAG TPA: AAA family ATPase [Kineosporiaceae bacterium]|nr:AAA family ATPase [Kineosporiaceae bacterium]